MVSEGKEQAIRHLSKAELAFLALLVDVNGGLAEGHDKPKTSYRLTFENIKALRGNLNRTTDGSHFEYIQSPKGLKFKIQNENDEQIKQAAEDDEVKEPKEGKTYIAILKNQEIIEILIEVNPHDIAEIIQSVPDSKLNY